jgi:hypothetical protein
MRKLMNCTPNINEPFSFQRINSNKIVLWDHFSKHNTLFYECKKLNKRQDLRISVLAIKYDFSHLK